MLKPEAIHADGASALHEPPQIAEVVAVAAVADDHAAQVHALLGEDGLLRLARSARRPRVRGDRHAGGLLVVKARTQDVFDDRRHALGVRRALDDGGLDAGASDALGNVAHEEIGDLVHAVAEEIALGIHHTPVATITCTRERRATSTMSSMSRPRSTVVRSTIARIPRPWRSVIFPSATLRISGRSNRCGQFSWTPGERVTMCSCIRVGPSSL